MKPSMISDPQLRMISSMVLRSPATVYALPPTIASSSFTRHVRIKGEKLNKIKLENLIYISQIKAVSIWITVPVERDFKRFVMSSMFLFHFCLSSLLT
jgi:hypothetical protein